MNDSGLQEKINQVRMLLLDVDGVLTSGDIIYDDTGKETKVFSVKDGLGLRLLMDAGIRVGIITGRSSGALRARCKNLGIDLLYDGISNKEEALEKIMDTFDLEYRDIAFVGDDLPDIRVMKKVGCGFAVNNACSETKKVSNYVSVNSGGQGAVREICELILKAKDLWEEAVSKFT